MRLGVGAVALGGFSVGFLRGLHGPVLFQQSAQPRPRGGVLGPLGHRPAVHRLGLLRHPQLAEPGGEVAAVVGVGVPLGRGAERRQRLLLPVGLGERLGDVQVKDGGPGIDRQRPADQVDRHVRPAALPGQHAQQVQGVCVRRPHRQQSPVGGVRLRKPTGLVVVQRRFQQWVDVRRHGSPAGWADDAGAERGRAGVRPAAFRTPRFLRYSAVSMPRSFTFLFKRVAVDPQEVGGLGLHAAALGQRAVDQRVLDLVDHELVDLALAQLVIADRLVRQPAGQRLDRFAATGSSAAGRRTSARSAAAVLR